MKLYTKFVVISIVESTRETTVKKRAKYTTAQVVCKDVHII